MRKRVQLTSSGSNIDVGGPAIHRTVLRLRTDACQGLLLSFQGHTFLRLCLQQVVSLCPLPLEQDDAGTYEFVEGQDTLSALRNSLPLSHPRSLSLQDPKSCATGCFLGLGFFWGLWFLVVGCLEVVLCFVLFVSLMDCNLDSNSFLTRLR